MRLSSQALAEPPSAAFSPAYDRERVRPGIAHLGAGNFHRAHQAAYIDRLLPYDGMCDWGIVGIGLLDDYQARVKASALNRQSGLYTLTECAPEGDPTIRIIGSMVEFLHAPDDPYAILRRLDDPSIRIVTMTITEGGYNTDESGRFRLEDPAVSAELADLAADGPPRSAFGFLTEALRGRREAGSPSFTVLSCDNLRHNGTVTRNATLAFARAREEALAKWIEVNTTFPSCMVDRITPATLPADKARLNRASGIDDESPVFCEDFTQWVIEDRFCAGRPSLELVDVQFTEDVDGYEQVKLRMLNGAHCVLSAPALLMGHRLVHQAIADPALRTLLERFLTEDAAPLLTPPPGLDLKAYGTSVIRRFSNPAVADQLLRILKDSASKLPIYVHPTLRGLLDLGHDHRRLAFFLACAVEYLRGIDDSGEQYHVAEPYLNCDNRTLASSKDLAMALRIGTFDGWDLELYPEFVEDFVFQRTLVRDQGSRRALIHMATETAPGMHVQVADIPKK